VKGGDLKLGFRGFKKRARGRERRSRMNNGEEEEATVKNFDHSPGRSTKSRGARCLNAPKKFFDFPFCPAIPPWSWCSTCSTLRGPKSVDFQLILTMAHASRHSLAMISAVSTALHHFSFFSN